jgi:AraC-like DNA-binding protein
MVTCSDALWLELLSRYDPAAADRPYAPFSISHTLATTPILRAYYALRRAARAAADNLAIEELTLALVDSVVHTAYLNRPSTSLERRAKTRAARADLAERIKLILASDPTRTHSLARLAAATESSPFHLARVFCQEVGMPVHRYLTRLRLALALMRLCDGGEGLSALAHALGFSSHSHLTTAFKREFGIAPSALRSSGKNLKVGR